MGIKDKMTELEIRKEPQILTKIIKEDTIGCHLVKAEIKEKYKYYVCDYCGEEIRVEKEWAKQTGGRYEIPQSLTKRGNIIIAIHNKCLKKVIRELEED